MASDALVFVIAGIIPAGSASPALRVRGLGQSYPPDRSSGEVIEVARDVTLRFSLPCTAGADFIELAIPALPGHYSIMRVELWGQHVADLGRRVLDVHDRLLESALPHEVRFASDRERPRVEIDVRGLATEASPAAPYLDIAIRREDAAAVLEGVLVAQAERLAGQVHELARETSDLAFGHGQALRRQSARQDEQAQELAALLEQSQQQSALLDSIRKQADVLVEQVSMFTESHTKGLATTQEQLAQVKFAIESVFWRRWLRRLRGNAR